MKTFYFYCFDVLNNNNKIIIVKANDEEQAKKLLLNTYFKGFSDWSYDEVTSMLEEKEFYITLVNKVECLE